MGHTVALHFWELQSVAPDFARFEELLNAEETARRDRFVFPRDRDAFVMARGGLRDILGRETGIAAAELTFTYGPQGKPALDSGPSFNLSHTGGLACLAIHDTLELGVDIEAYRLVEGDIAGRFFSSTENAALDALPKTEREYGFFRYWTRKEAVIKALGGGLSIPLNDFDVSLDVDHAALLRIAPTYGDVNDWAMTSFKCGDAMWGAVAAKTGGAPVTLDIKRRPKGLAITV